MIDAEYHRLAGAALAAVEATLDRWLQDDVIDIDAQRTGGLLELSLPGGSKIVINTQPPAARAVARRARAGGFHFKYRDGAWRDTKDGVDFLRTPVARRRACKQAVHWSFEPSCRRRSGSASRQAVPP